MQDLQADTRDSLRGAESWTSAASSNGPKQSHSAKIWYPIVLLNHEIKKSLPLEGVEWLFTRVRAKIRNARMDLEVAIIIDKAEFSWQ